MFHLFFAKGSAQDQVGLSYPWQTWSLAERLLMQRFAIYKINFHEKRLHVMSKIKGPDNPTSQLLPILSNTCCSGDGEGRKDKGGGGGSRSKTSCMWRVVCVCDKVACERWCVVKKDGAQKPTRPSLALLHEANEKHHCAMQSALQQSRNLHTQVSHAKVTSIAKAPTSPTILT